MQTQPRPVCRYTYPEIERRFPVLISAMKWAAILTPGEAADCIRALIEQRGSSEAVEHFGGPPAVFRAALRCRRCGGSTDSPPKPPSPPCRLNNHHHREREKAVPITIRVNEHPVTITDETIQLTRDWFSQNARNVVSNTTIGKDKPNEPDRWIAYWRQREQDVINGKFDHSIAFIQRAIFIQTGGSVPMFSPSR